MVDALGITYWREVKAFYEDLLYLQSRLLVNFSENKFLFHIVAHSTKLTSLEMAPMETSRKSSFDAEPRGRTIGSTNAVHLIPCADSHVHPLDRQTSRPCASSGSADDQMSTWSSEAPTLANPSWRSTPTTPRHPRDIQNGSNNLQWSGSNASKDTLLEQTALQPVFDLAVVDPERRWRDHIAKPQSGSTNDYDSIRSVGKTSARTMKTHLKCAISPSVDFDSTQVFDCPTRKPLRVNYLKATFNIILSFGLIVALITGYAIGLSIFDLGVTSIGLYGTILLSEYLVQVFCAVSNRVDVNRIANNLKKKTTECQQVVDCERGERNSASTGIMNPYSQVSIAVVGYREDEKSWRECLRSLQTQTLKPKCVVGVVDGNEEPDISMANAFVDEFKSHKAPLIHLPILLSDLHRDTYLANIPEDTRSKVIRFSHYLSGRHRPGHLQALSLARQVIINQVTEWDNRWNISGLDAVCFSQPHGHKRTAMFTSFAISLWALKTRDAIFTTDSDTLVQDNGLDEMLTLLRSQPEIGGVTADVKIWNRAEGLLTRLCAARYWFAFNIERACQSMWRCVGCLSGPMSMYRSSDLETILGPWNLQTFGGKHTTFGDDRHLTNQLLAHGLKTRYTHRTWCDSESPTTFVRWVAQQTRWSKSFFREAFWFPASFAYQSPWMLVEMTIQTLYPFILIATVFHLLFDASDANKWRPLIWLATMFGIAFFKCLVALFICRDPWLLLFACYGFIYFFGLLPSKVWALLTMNSTGWGTSARSSAERKRGQSFVQRSFHVGHLVIWYTAIFVGLGFFTYKMFENALFMLIGVFALLVSLYLYSDSISGAIKEKSQACWAMVTRQRKASPDGYSVFMVDESMLPEKPSAAVSRSPITRDELSSVEVMGLRTMPDATTGSVYAAISAPPKVARL
jgi:hyaluronan synthase